MTRPLILALGLLTALTGVACAEADSTATINDAEDFVPSHELVRRAETVLETTNAATAEGWTLGVVIAENADGWRSDWSVLTEDGNITIIGLAVQCADDGDDIEERDLVLALDPGDLISWSPAGNDHVICSGEIITHRKFAA